MIQIRNITKTYDRKVLDGVSHDFHRGKLYVIRGVSGCGKTTLLNIIGGLETNYEGFYYFNGEEVGKDKKILEKVRSNIGYIFQESLLFANLNVRENLMFIKNDNEKIEELAKRLGVENLLNKMPNELSNGERQRISIIRALLFDPDVMIADEPTAALDHLRCIDIEDVLYQLRDMGKVVIVSTHDISFGKQADEILQLDYGKMESSRLYEIKAVHEEKKIKKSKSMWKIDAIYCIRRGKKMNVGSTIIYTIIFCIFLMICAIRLNFQNVFEAYIYGNYPCHVISDMSSTEDLIETYSKDIKIYEDYHFEDGRQHVNGLFDKTDSVFSIPGAISYGKFPEQNEEVLVNTIYVKNVLELDHAEDAIDKKIKVKGQEYHITGVISDDEKLMEKLYESDDYLDENYMDKNNVFMPYDEIKAVRTFHESKQRMIAVYPALKDKEICINMYTYWQHYASELVSNINFFMDVFLLIALALLFIMFLFMLNIIRVEMMYRKREIGYMRLFSISKKRIHHMIMFDYLMKVGISLILSNVGMFVLSYFIHYKFHIWVMLSPMQWLFLMMVLLGYLWILTRLAIRKIMKKPIKELI